MRQTLFILLLVLLMTATASAQKDFSYTTFDVPGPGVAGTKAFRGNARGDIVGRYFIGGNGPHGFLRKADGTFTAPIDVPVTNTGTVCRGINARGDIVGRYFDNSGNTHGFLLETDGTFTTIDVPSTAPLFGVPGTTVAEQLNNMGEIVGFYDAPTILPNFGLVNLTHGFLRHTDGRFERIDFPGSDITLASGTTDQGKVVGTYFIIGTGFPVTSIRGFVREHDGSYKSIDVPVPSAFGTIVNGMNDAGDIEGSYLSTAVDITQFSGDNGVPGTAYFLSSTGSLTQVEVPGAFPLATSALGINPRGNVIGEYIDASGEHGFVATK